MISRALPLVLVAAAVAPAVAGGHHGRIVRIERPRTGGRGLPRVCQLNSERDGKCYGKPPREGEVASIIDDHGYRGTVEIGTVTEIGTGQCVDSWTFELAPINADLKDIEPYRTWAVLDLDVGRGAHTIEPSTVKAPDNPDQTAWMAIDRGRDELGHAGDPKADFQVVAFQCDAEGNPPSGMTNGGYCLDYWSLLGSRWSQLRRDIVVLDPDCNK